MLHNNQIIKLWKSAAFSVNNLKNVWFNTAVDNFILYYTRHNIYTILYSAGYYLSSSLTVSHAQSMWLILQAETGGFPCALGFKGICTLKTYYYQVTNQQYLTLKTRLTNTKLIACNCLPNKQ